MPDNAIDLHGLRALICGNDGPKLETERDGNDLLGAAFGENADMVVLPVARLSDNFFRLNTRLAGDIVQKFVNYKIRLVIVGDVAAWISASKPFNDFVTEANRGNQLWFVESMDELRARLSKQQLGR